MPSPLYPPWSYHPLNCWRGVQATKILVCSFQHPLLLRSKCKYSRAFFSLFCSLNVRRPILKHTLLDLYILIFTFLDISRNFWRFVDRVSLCITIT
jgi:hypothetical protein